MSHRFLTALTALVILSAAGCLGTAPVDSHSNHDEHADNNLSRGSVLTTEQLRGENGSLLDAMTRKLLSFKADRRYSCPAISLRGNVNTIPGHSEPLIFVDGIMAVDTCILSHLSAADVSRVEVYPMGFTHRPGYATNPHGLILIFMRQR